MTNIQVGDRVWIDGRSTCGAATVVAIPVDSAKTHVTVVMDSETARRTFGISIAVPIAF